MDVSNENNNEATVKEFCFIYSSMGLDICFSSCLELKVNKNPAEKVLLGPGILAHLYIWNILEKMNIQI